MYNNFSSKKTKKVISALLATALVATSAPITADAATAKVVGVGKTFTIKKTTKVSGLSKAEKKIVKVTVNKKKRTVTVKGIKAGKATFKIGKKTYNVKVGATGITKKTVTTSMTAGQKKTLSVNAVNGKGDTIQFTSSNKNVVKVNKASATATAKKVASTTVTALKAGTAKITAKSKYTGKSKTFTIKVAAATVTPAPEVTTNPAVVATTPAATSTVTNGPSNPGGSTTTKAPEATSGAATTAPGTSANPDETKNPDATGTPSATDVVSTDAPTTEVPATEAPVPTKTPDVTTGSGVTTEAGVKVTGITSVGLDKITVEFEPLTEDISEVSIKIVDDEGQTVSVYAKDLVKGDSSATFTFKKAFTKSEQIKGIWYVEGVAYDVVVVNALAVIYANTANQIDLLDALKALDLVDVSENNIKLYKDAFDVFADTYSSSSQLTVEAVQEVVNKVNKEAVTESDCIKALNGIIDSRNQIALLAALQTTGVFERVNPDWIAEYDEAFDDTAKDGLDPKASDISAEVKEAQDIINAVNATHFTTSAQDVYFGSETPSTAGGKYCLSKDDIETYISNVNKYMVPDTTTTTTKATLLGKLKAQVAICNVIAAETPAQLTIAINALKTLDSAYVLDMDNYIDDNRVEYVKALNTYSETYKTKTDDTKDTVLEINGILKTVNEAVALKPIAELVNYAKTEVTAKTTSKAKVEALYKALSKVSGLKNLVKENAGFYANCAAAVDTYGVDDATIASSGTESYAVALTNIKALDVGDRNTDAATSVDVLKAQLQRTIDQANLAAVVARADVVVEASTGVTQKQKDELYAALVYFGNDVKDLSSENVEYYASTDIATAIAGINLSTNAMALPTANDSDTYPEDVSEATKKGFTDGLKTKLDADVVLVQTQIDAANLTAVLKTTTAEALLAKLNIITQLENVKPENAKEYFKGYATNTGIYNGGPGAYTVVKLTGTGSAGTVLDTVLSTINASVEDASLVKALNKAKTAEDVRTALTKIALSTTARNTTYAKYINLSNADKLLVAGMFMNDDTFGTTGTHLVSGTRTGVAFGAYDDVTAPTTTVDTTVATDLDAIIDEVIDQTWATGAYAGSEAIVNAVNKLFVVNDGASPIVSKTPSIQDVQTELARLVLTGYTAYDKLTAAQKLEVAEAFISAYPVDSDGNHIVNSYKSLSAYEAAVDAAIASVVK